MVVAIRIATLNIWNRMPPWEDRLAVVRSGLRMHQPDLIGLQEVLRVPTEDGTFDQAEEIARGLGYDVVYGEGHRINGTVSFGNALLSRLPIIDHAVVALPGHDESDQRRSVLRAEVSVGGSVLPVLVTHLNWKRDEGPIRRRQIERVLGLVAGGSPAAPRGPSSPHGASPWVGNAAPERARIPPGVLVGDFNAGPDSDEIDWLRRQRWADGSPVMIDAWTGAADAGHPGRSGDERAQPDPGHTRHPRNPCAALAHDRPRRVDYVWVCPRIRVNDVRLVFDQPIDGTWASDHFGVLADLDVPTRSAP